MFAYFVILIDQVINPHFDNPRYSILALVVQP